MREETGKLGLIDCVVTLIGGMFGSAIFSLSGPTYVTAGPASIISWAVAGMILLLCGLQNAELAIIYPQAGGSFVFPYNALGKTERAKQAWGWASAWSYLNSYCFGAAFSAVYVAQYLMIAFPFFSNVILWAVVWCIGCIFLASFNITASGKANLIMVAGIIVILAAFFFIGLPHFNMSNFSNFFTSGTGGALGTVKAIPTAMLAYGAIITLAFLSSSVRNPNKTIPKAMVIAMAVTVFLYCITIFAMVAMLNISYFESNPGMVYVPIYAVAWSVLGNIPWLPGAISIAAVLALTSTLLVLLLASSWTMQAAAEAGFLPKFLAYVNPKSGAPVPSVICCGIIITGLSCIPDATGMLANTGAICLGICVVITAVSLLSARRTYTRRPGEFYIHGKAFWPIVSIIICLIFITPGVFQEWKYWGLALIWYAAGVVIYIISQALHADKKTSTN